MSTAKLSIKHVDLAFRPFLIIYYRNGLHEHYVCPNATTRLAIHPLQVTHRPLRRVRHELRLYVNEDWRDTTEKATSGSNTSSAAAVIDWKFFSWRRGSVKYVLRHGRRCKDSVEAKYRNMVLLLVRQCCYKGRRVTFAGVAAEDNGADDFVDCGDASWINGKFRCEIHSWDVMQLE